MLICSVSGFTKIRKSRPDTSSALIAWFVLIGVGDMVSVFTISAPSDNRAPLDARDDNRTGLGCRTVVSSWRWLGLWLFSLPFAFRAWAAILSDTASIAAYRSLPTSLPKYVLPLAV